MSVLPAATAKPMTRLFLRITLTLLILLAAWGIHRYFLPTGTGQSPVSSAATWTSQDAIALYQARLRTNSEDVEAYTLLGMALLQQVRETGDPSAYSRADQAFTEALTRQPDLFDALLGAGLLALSRHDFHAALDWADQARQANPYRAETWGIYTDAYVELGRYSEAIVAAQEMVDMRPGVASYSRVSYVRELHGNIDGAIAAMQAAVDACLPDTEPCLWATVQLGNLYFHQGNWEQAETVFAQALSWRGDYIYALGGMARVQAARGDVQAALKTYTELTQRMPLPEFVIALGDLYTLLEDPQKAAEQYNLVRMMQKLNQAAGVDVDLEMALFAVDHGDDATAALELARTVYMRRPSIHAADALAWALYHTGDYTEAQRYSQESLRLGTQDAQLYFHAGMIAHANGDFTQARRYLQQALDINPAFSLIHARTANKMLKSF